ATSRHFGKRMIVMTRTRSHWMLTCAATLALGAINSTASAQMSETRIRELIKQAAEQVATSQQPTPPAPQTAQGTTRPTVHLTLDEAVKFALDRNLDIAVQRLNPEINDIAVASINSVYHPSLTSTISQASTNGTPQNILQLSSGGLGTNTNQLTYNGGLAQSIPQGGGS